ncbi:hypothetical protein HYC85_023243 [Camellia sinensis]|uniref:Uncharacterized protein n=1 Tax=Camellia sinensis TaxID=4442 RepID=A0A7J7GHS4_CAMSI|nr:hypothetical protein HYC85_023243 [Camellia sinensis]
MILLFFFIFKPQFFKPEHEQSIPIFIIIKQPVIYIPRDLYINTINFDSLIASEFPLQVLYLQYPFLINTEIEFWIITIDSTIDRYVS